MNLCKVDQSRFSSLAKSLAKVLTIATAVAWMRNYDEKTFGFDEEGFLSLRYSKIKSLFEGFIV